MPSVMMSMTVILGFRDEKGSWNIYGEYQTSLIKDGWDGPAVKNSYRFNITYTIPIGF